MPVNSISSGFNQMKGLSPLATSQFDQHLSKGIRSNVNLPLIWTQNRERKRANKKAKESFDFTIDVFFSCSWPHASVC